MRDVEIRDGLIIEAKALTRKQVKELRSKGFTLDNLQRDQAEDALDAIFEMVLDAGQIEAIDDCPYHVALKVFKSIISETYGAKDEEKNS